MAKIKWSIEPEEWYCSYGKCCTCGTEFMCSEACYCPGCGEMIETEERASMIELQEESEETKNEN